MLCAGHNICTSQNADSVVVQAIDAMRPDIEQQLAVQRGNSDRMAELSQEQKRLSKEVQDATHMYVKTACCAGLFTSQHGPSRQERC